MSMSPEAIQAIASRIAAVYVGSSIGTNVSNPLIDYNDNPTLKTGLAAAVGSATIGVAAISIISTSRALPYIGTVVGIASLQNNLNDIIDGATNKGEVKTSSILGAASDITGLIGSISLTLAVEGAVIGLAGATVAPALIVGAVLSVAAVGLIIESQAAGKDVISTPELKAMSDVVNQYLSEFGDAAKKVTDVMMDPVFWDAFATNGVDLVASLFSNALDFLFTPAYGADINPLVANQFTLATVATPPVRRDPLVFDLDGDGLETTGVSTANPIYFDHDADGVKTATGWVKSDDAFLVLDKNANGTIDSGRELFGDAFVKSNGQLAADGFDALRDLDSNADGKVDAADAQFANLRLWRDLNQDGISQSNELFTLSSQNIAAINTGSTAHSQILANGNQLADLGSFVKTDGSVATLGEVTGNLCDINLVQDTFHRQFTDHLDTRAVATLPDMQGAGQVRSLREAATLSPVLAQLLTDFAAADRTGQQALLDQIIKAWSDTSNMAATFTGAYVGHGLTVNLQNLAVGSAAYNALADKLTILEHFNGRTFNTVPAIATANDETWRMVA